MPTVVKLLKLNEDGRFFLEINYQDLGLDEPYIICHTKFENHTYRKKCEKTISKFYKTVYPTLGMPNVLKSKGRSTSWSTSWSTSEWKLVLKKNPPAHNKVQSSVCKYIRK